MEDKQLETGWLPTPLEYRVYTPPCYPDRPDQHYPVLFLIHGYGFNQDQWDRLGADEIADRIISAGEISPFIIVMPYDRNHNSQPPKNQFGQALLELVDMMDASYRTIPIRQYRAIGGLSRGGNWAIQLGLTYWTTFGVIGGHSSPLFVSYGPSNIEEWLGQIPPDQYPRVYLDIGRNDKLIDPIIHFEERLDDYNIPHELYIFSGGHNEDYWASHIEQYIRWYAKEW
ncbi:MAG: esterase family protein [Anaerolineales bacterium]|nr:esterase family protein [Anaerolineales bacterium]